MNPSELHTFQLQLAQHTVFLVQPASGSIPAILLTPNRVVSLQPGVEAEPQAPLVSWLQAS